MDFGFAQFIISSSYINKESRDLGIVQITGLEEDQIRKMEVQSNYQDLYWYNNVSES
jgi:hypothetical protein